MAGGTSAFNMKQSSEDNRSIKPARSKMGDNPYSKKGISIDKRNPSNYRELIQHRFWRKAFSQKITFVYYLILGVLIISAMVYLMIFR
jgi:hypothetical protein